MTRLIAHVDMDSFFVSCERLLNPALRGKPVIVGGRKGERGVVCSASYEARPFGVRSGMPLRTAEKLCPQALFVPGTFKLYSKYSRRVYVLLKRIAPVVEYASIDEFYLDFTGCEALYGNDLTAMAQKTRESIFNRTQLSCSVAIASNKYVAKIAGKTVKPSSGKAGWIVVPEGGEQTFLAILPIERLHGAGEKTQPRLKAMGIQTIGDLSALPLKKLEEAFGDSGGHWMYEAARGLDDSPVTAYHPSKSVGHETTFDQDTGDPVVLRQTLAWLSEKSCYRLRRLGKKARTITLKLRYDNFETLTRAQTIPATHDDAVVLRSAEELMNESRARNRKIRLLGVSLSKFEEGGGESWLFPEMDDPRKEILFKSMDAIKRKYGFNKLGKASSLDSSDRNRPLGEGPSSFEKPKTC